MSEPANGTVYLVEYFDGLAWEPRALVYDSREDALDDARSANERHGSNDRVCEYVRNGVVK